MADIFYEWYKKLVTLKGGTTAIAEDVYNRDPLAAWEQMLGIRKAGPLKVIKERGQAAREAAEKSDALLRARGGR